MSTGGSGGSGGGYAGSGGSGAGGAGGTSPGDGGPTDSNSVGTGGSGGPRPDAPPADPNCMPSKHYGRNGEMWMPDGRFLDWGYAGYHTGLDPIPNVAGPIKMVTEFGAKGDDMADDTDAFTQAVEMTNGVLLVPAGRYILTKQLFIKKSNFVLRGEGQGKTILYFPRPLTEVGVGGTSWSFNGGFITTQGTDEGPVIGMVTANAPKGAQKLQVSATTGVQPGSWVRIIQTDRAGSLFRALYGGMHPGNVGEDGGTEVFRFYSKVTAVDAGSITLERHLPFQVDTNWTPTVRAGDADRARGGRRAPDPGDGPHALPGALQRARLQRHLLCRRPRQLGPQRHTHQRRAGHQHLPQLLRHRHRRRAGLQRVRPGARSATTA